MPQPPPQPPQQHRSDPDCDAVCSLKIVPVAERKPCDELPLNSRAWGLLLHKTGDAKMDREIKERAEKAEIAALLALNPGDECYYYMGRAFAPEQVRVMEVHDHPDSPYPHLLRKRFTVDFLVYCKQEPGSMVPCECARECGEWVCPGKPQGIPFRTNIMYMLSLDAGDELMLEIAREYFPGDGGDLL